MHHLFATLMVAGCGAGESGDRALSVESSSSSHSQSLVARPTGPTGRYQNQSEFISGVAYQTWGFRPMEKGARADSPEGRSVIESDVYRLAGDTLYVLNPYRGLQIIDLSRPQAPALRGRLEIYGTPHEMYVDTAARRAHLLVSDSVKYENRDLVRYSRLLSVDLSNPAKPRAISSIEIPGSIVESRQVGSVIYVVGTEWLAEGGERTTVKSIQVGGNGAPKQVQTLSLEGNAYQIHASPEFLFVAQNSEQATSIEVVGIASPTGVIQRGSKISIPGLLHDKHHLSFHNGVLRAVTHHWDGGGTIFVKTLSVGADNTARELGSLTLPNIGSLLATRFDGPKAYLVHMVRIDPLDVIDLSDPAKPVRLSSLEIPGWLEDMEIRGDKVIGIGFDTVNGQQQLAAALYDVSDPRHTRELSRVHLGKGLQWQWASFHDSRAFRFFDDKKLLLVPFSGSTAQGAIHGVQLVDVNLAAGTLQARGKIDQSGDALRTFAVREQIGAFSNRELTVANVVNRDAPVITGRLELSRHVAGLQLLPTAAVQLINDWQNPAELRAVSLDTPDAELGEVFSRIVVKDAVRIFASSAQVIAVSHRWLEPGSEMILAAYDFRNPRRPVKRGELGLKVDGIVYGFSAGSNVSSDLIQINDTQFAVVTEIEGSRSVRLINFSNADVPTVAATASLPADGELGEVRAIDGALYVGTFKALPEPEEPAVDAGTDTGTATDGMVADQPLGKWGGPGRTVVRAGRHYAIRVAVGARSLTVSSPVNVPGVVVDVDAAGRLITLDTQVDLADSAKGDKSLDALQISFTAGKAYLKGLVDVHDRAEGALARGGQVYFTHHERSETGGTNPLARIWWGGSPKDWTLHTVSAQGFRLWEHPSALLQRDGAGQLLDVVQVGNQRFAFATYSGAGLGVYDVSQPGRPVLKSFAPVNTWFETVKVDLSRRVAHLWSGFNGVKSITLQ
jgi:hypothetical protein